MLISSIPPLAVYTYTGDTNTFSIPFPFYGFSSIQVMYGKSYDPDMSFEDFEDFEDLQRDLDFTISGTPIEKHENTQAYNYGEVVLKPSVSIPIGYVLLIFRQTPIHQRFKYSELDNFPAKSHENALGYLTVIMQEMQNRVKGGLPQMAVAYEELDDINHVVAVAVVDSIADLLALPEGQRKEGLRYLVKGYHAGSDVGGGEFYWDDSADKSTADGGAIVDPESSGGYDGAPSSLEGFYLAQGSGDGSGCFIRCFNGDVSPYDFGFVDGDSLEGFSTEVLKRTFEAARSLYRPVSFSGVEEIVIRREKPENPINIYTSTNFSGATLIIENGIVENLNRNEEPPEGTGGKPIIFRIERPHERVRVYVNPSSVTKGSSKIVRSGGGLLEDGYYVLVDIYSALPPRKFMGAWLDPENFIFFFQVRGGEMTSEIPLDVSYSGVEVYYYGSPSPISVSDLRIDTESFNSATVLSCRRSNVEISRITSIGGRPSEHEYRDFISLFYCGGVTLRDISLPQHWIINSKIAGSYVIAVTAITDCLIDNFVAAGDHDTWGAMGTNYINNLTIQNSKLGRFDVHAGMYGKTYINNCIIGRYGVMYGWGAGSLVVDNCSFVGVQHAVSCRGDYWGQFDGSVTISGCEIKFDPEALVKSIYYIGSAMLTELPWGHSQVVCRSVDVRDITVRDTQTEEADLTYTAVNIAYLLQSNRSFTHEVIGPEYINASNLSFFNCSGLHFVQQVPSPEIDTRDGVMQISLSGVKNPFARDGVAGRRYALLTSRQYTPVVINTEFNVSISECSMVGIDMPFGVSDGWGVTTSISNSSIHMILAENMKRVDLNGCSILPNSSNVLANFGGNFVRAHNCTVEAPNRSTKLNLRSAIGLVVNDSNNVSYLREDMTHENVFYGYNYDLP